MMSKHLRNEEFSRSRTSREHTYIRSARLRDMRTSVGLDPRIEEEEEEEEEEERGVYARSEREHHTKPDSAVLFFYFDFNEVGKR